MNVSYKKAIKMETNKILTADFLDILFEGRNKEYGAYELRKTYNKRIGLALIIMSAVFLIIFVGSVVAKNLEATDKSKTLEVKDLALEEVKAEEKPPPPPPPPPKLPPPPPIQTIQFTPPKIVKDQEVIKPPVENEKLEEAKVDVKTVEGTKDVGIVAPPVEDKGTQVVEVPKQAEDEDKVFTKVEIEASFKGSWGSYVKKEIEAHIDELTDAGESGTVRVRFIVSKDGTVSDVEALTMKNSKLAEVAVNAIRKGPKWTPAQQNGRFVNAYREQPVTFTIQDQ